MHIDSTHPHRYDPTLSVDLSDVIEVAPLGPRITPRSWPRPGHAVDATLVDAHPGPMHPQVQLHQVYPSVDQELDVSAVLDPVGGTFDDHEQDDDGPRPIGRKRSWGGSIALTGLLCLAGGSWALGTHLWLQRDGSPIAMGAAAPSIPIVWVKSAAEAEPARVAKQRARRIKKTRATPTKPASRRVPEGRSIAGAIIADARDRQAVRKTSRRRARRIGAKAALAQARRAMGRRAYGQARSKAILSLRARPDRRTRRAALKLRRSAESAMARQARVNKRLKRARQAYKRRQWKSARRWARAALRIDARNRPARRLAQLATRRLRRG